MIFWIVWFQIAGKITPFWKNGFRFVPLWAWYGVIIPYFSFIGKTESSAMSHRVAIQSYFVPWKKFWTQYGSGNLRFTEVFVDKSYTYGWYKVCVIGDVHFFESLLHVWDVKPLTELFCRHSVFVCQLAFCLGAYLTHISWDSIVGGVRIRVYLLQYAHACDGTRGWSVCRRIANRDTLYRLSSASRDSCHKKHRDWSFVFVV